MKIFIVHRDVPYEFGEVWGVFLTLDEAKLFIQNADVGKLELGIEVWETEGNVKLEELRAPQ